MTPTSQSQYTTDYSLVGWNSSYFHTEENYILLDSASDHTQPSGNSSTVDAGCRMLEFLPWNNSDNIISYQTKMLFFRVLGGVLIPCFSLFGIPVNILNCVVFFKHGLQERINLLLFCLACSDFAVCTFLFVSTIEYFYTQVQGNFRINGPLATFSVNYGSVIYGAVYVSGFISTLISFERCICITRPLIAKQILKTKTMGIIVAVAAVVLIILMYFISASKFRIDCGYYPPLKMYFFAHYPSQWYLENKLVMDIVNGIVYGICLPSFFGVASTITTIVTAIKLRGAATWRQNTSSATIETKEIALTKMLIVVSCLFILCTVPNVILRIAPVVVKELKLGGRNQNMLMSGVNIVFFSNSVNSALNFIFYFKMGSKFRATLMGLCRRNQRRAELNKPTVFTTKEAGQG